LAKEGPVSKPSQLIRPIKLLLEVAVKPAAVLVKDNKLGAYVTACEETIVILGCPPVLKI
jgi:hypothetical protein